MEEWAKKEDGFIVTAGTNEVHISITEARVLAGRGTILRATVGSTLHGLHVPGADDRDEMGVCVEPPDYVMGLRDFEQWTYRTQPEGVRSGPGDLDVTVYGLRKYCRLAAKGNPSLLVLLHAPVEAHSVLRPIGADLRAIADKFASKMAVRKFLGYMTAQKERLLGERGQMRVKRPELIETFGYDTKYAMHALRLGRQGIEFAETGRLTLPMPEPHRTDLLAVRTGAFNLSHVTEMYEDLQRRLEMALHSTGAGACQLPQEPDWHGIDSFLMRAYERHWDGNQRMAMARRDWP